MAFLVSQARALLARLSANQQPPPQAPLASKDQGPPLAVVFDIGGVITHSPLQAIDDYEASAGIPLGFLNACIIASGPQGAFPRLERGELTGPAFCKAFEDEVLALSHCGEEFGKGWVAFHSLYGRWHPSLRGTVRVDADAFLTRIMEAGSRPVPAMLHAIAVLREHGMRVAALTNNFHATLSPSSSAHWRLVRERAGQIHGLFDLVVESCETGSRKPEPEMYATLMRALESKWGITDPKDVVFLDDLGLNLKPAQAMGMRTIHVKRDVDGPDTGSCLAVLEEVTGITSLRRPTEAARL